MAPITPRGTRRAGGAAPTQLTPRVRMPFALSRKSAAAREKSASVAASGALPRSPAASPAPRRRTSPAIPMT